MNRFAIVLIKGNDETVISLHATKEEALAAGETYNKGLSKNAGIVSCIFSEFSESKEKISGKSQIHHVWM